MVKYNSITNSYQKEFIDKAVAKHSERGIDEKAVVVLEKIDGANIGIEFDDKIKFQSRNQELKENSDFYNFNEVLKNHTIIEKLQKLYEYKFNPKKVVFFGEIFGGIYDGDKRGKPVQARVNYCPENYIMFFDIFVDGEYLPWIDACDLFDDFNIPRVPELRIFGGDSFKENIRSAIQIDPASFTTRVPSAIDKSGDVDYRGRLSRENKVEGFIIRPLMFDMMVSDFDRFILKVKNDKFTEIKIDGPKTPDIKNYINENRIRSAISKFEPNNFGAIVNEIFEDIFKDFERDNGELSEDEKKLIKKKHSKEFFIEIKNLKESE